MTGVQTCALPILEEEQNARNIQEKEIIDAIFYGDEAYKKSIGSKIRF